MTDPAISAAIIVDSGRVLMARRRVAEGKLSWQFPAGAVEADETPEAAAVRETQEEVGLTVRASTRLGERVHPNTGRTMIYIACRFVSGDAFVADEEELAEVEWCDRKSLEEHVPYPLFEPVQEYLNSSLS